MSSLTVYGYSCGLLRSWVALQGTKSEPGVLPRALKQLFQVTLANRSWACHERPGWHSCIPLPGFIGSVSKAVT